MSSPYTFPSFVASSQVVFAKIASHVHWMEPAEVAVTVATLIRAEAFVGVWSHRMAYRILAMTSLVSLHWARNTSCAHFAHRTLDQRMWDKCWPICHATTKTFAAVGCSYPHWRLSRKSIPCVLDLKAHTWERSDWTRRCARS